MKIVYSEWVAGTFCVRDKSGYRLGDGFRSKDEAQAFIRETIMVDLLAACESAAVLLDALQPGSHVAAECHAAIAAAKGETT